MYFMLHSGEMQSFAVHTIIMMLLQHDVLTDSTLPFAAQVCNLVAFECTCSKECIGLMTAM